MSQVAKRASLLETDRRPAFFYRSAREGVQDLLTGRGLTDPRGILLPAYIGWSAREGSGVFDPVQAVGMHAGFYGLHDDLSVDVEEMTALARTGEFGILVVIHYFGRALVEMAEIRRICDSHGMLLVEDMAHAFFTSVVGRSAGIHGDVGVFSLHKMFPIPTGGMVTYAAGIPVRGATSTAPELANSIIDYDWAAIAERRRANFLGLSSRLSSLPECGDAFNLIWPKLNLTDVPQTLPVYVSGDMRDAIYGTMNEQGFGMVSLYHTLIPEVRQDHPELVRLARHIINFPCHQDVAESDLDELVTAFRRALRQC